jgi:hypothetical protein
VTAHGTAQPRDAELWLMPREYELGARQWLGAALLDMQREIHPLLAQVSHETLAEGPLPLPTGVPQPGEASSLFRPMGLSHTWTLAVDEVIRFDVQEFLAKLFSAADDTGGQMVRGMLEHISDMTTQTGNVIEAGGRDFFDLWADVLETIEMTFDEHGNHNLTLVMHPDQMEKLKDRKPTPEQEARINAILERRREEWRASRRRRDLP